jgi:hypothetical protein
VSNRQGHRRGPYRTGDSPFGGVALSKIDRQWRFKHYGLYPRCRRCREGCQQYAAPGLTRMICKRSPEWEVENEKIGSLGGDQEKLS